MFIELSELIKNVGSEKAFVGECDVESIPYMGELISFPKPVKVDVNVKNVGGVLCLNGRAECEMLVNCGRCGKPLTENLDFEIEESLLYEGSNVQMTDDEDVIIFSGYRFELDEIVSNYIFMNLPIRYLCKEDCLGVCPKCGKDLNVGDCGCDKQEIDPRLEALKKLL